MKKNYLLLFLLALIGWSSGMRAEQLPFTFTSWESGDARWKSLVTTAYKKEHQVSFSDQGTLTVTFTYTNDNNRFEVFGIDLVSGTDVVKSDYRHLFAGGDKVGQVFTISDIQPGDYTLRYWTSRYGNGNVDFVTGGSSQGTIVSSYTGTVSTEHPLPTGETWNKLTGWTESNDVPKAVIDLIRSKGWDPMSRLFAMDDEGLVFTQGGIYNAKFAYVGSKPWGLDFTAVQVLRDGQLVSEDRHAGFVGGEPRNPDYRIVIPAEGGSFTIRTIAQSKSATDDIYNTNNCQGSVTYTRIGEAPTFSFIKLQCENGLGYMKDTDKGTNRYMRVDTEDTNNIFAWDGTNLYSYRTGKQVGCKGSGYLSCNHGTSYLPFELMDISGETTTDQGHNPDFHYLLKYVDGSTTYWAGHSADAFGRGSGLYNNVKSTLLKTNSYHFKKVELTDYHPYSVKINKPADAVNTPFIMTEHQVLYNGSVYAAIGDEDGNVDPSTFKPSKIDGYADATVTVDNTSKTITVNYTASAESNNKYVVLVVAGQSNAVGYDESVVTWDDLNTEPGNIVQLGYVGANNMKIMPLGHCAQSYQYETMSGKVNLESLEDPNGPGTKGLQLPLAELLYKNKKFVPEGYKLLVISASYGGHCFGDGKWGVNSGNYTQMRDRVKYVLDLNSENKYLGCVWIQGEFDAQSDAYMNANLTGFPQMVEAYNTYFTSYSDRTIIEGGFTKDIWWNMRSTAWWSGEIGGNSGYQAADRSARFNTILQKYEEWNPTTYITFDTDEYDTNQHWDGTVVDANRPSSNWPTHFGNHAYRIKIAPIVYDAITMDRGNAYLLRQAIAEAESLCVEAGKIGFRKDVNGALQTALDAAKAKLNAGEEITEDDVTALNEACTTYTQGTEVNLPEAGHIYKFNIVFADQSAKRYVINDVTTVSQTTVAPTTIDLSYYWKFDGQKFCSLLDDTKKIAFGSNGESWILNTTGADFTTSAGKSIGDGYVTLQSGGKNRGMNKSGSFGAFTPNGNNPAKYEGESGQVWSTNFEFEEVNFDPATELAVKIQEAQTLIDAHQDKIGFPKAEYAEALRTALQAAKDETSVTTYINLTAAISNYKLPANLLLPEENKVYRFNIAFAQEQYKDTKYYVVLNSNDALEATTDEPAEDASGDGSGYWLFDGQKFVNIKDHSKYLTVTSTKSMTVGSDGANFTLSLGTKYGYITMYASGKNRGIDPNKQFGEFSSGKYDGNNNGGWSTNFEFAEIHYNVAKFYADQWIEKYNLMREQQNGVDKQVPFTPISSKIQPLVEALQSDPTTETLQTLKDALADPDNYYPLPTGRYIVNNFHDHSASYDINQNKKETTLTSLLQPVCAAGKVGGYWSVWDITHNEANGTYTMVNEGHKYVMTPGTSIGTTDEGVLYYDPNGANLLKYKVGNASQVNNAVKEFKFTPALAQNLSVFGVTTEASKGYVTISGSYATSGKEDYVMYLDVRGGNSGEGENSQDHMVKTGKLGHNNVATDNALWSFTRLDTDEGNQREEYLFFDATEGSLVGSVGGVITLTNVSGIDVLNEIKTLIETGREKIRSNAEGYKKETVGERALKYKAILDKVEALKTSKSTYYQNLRENSEAPFYLENICAIRPSLYSRLKHNGSRFQTVANELVNAATPEGGFVPTPVTSNDNSTDGAFTLKTKEANATYIKTKSGNGNVDVTTNAAEAANIKLKLVIPTLYLLERTNAANTYFTVDNQGILSGYDKAEISAIWRIVTFNTVQVEASTPITNTDFTSPAQEQNPESDPAQVVEPVFTTFSYELPSRIHTSRLIVPYFITNIGLAEYWKKENDDHRYDTEQTDGTKINRVYITMQKAPLIGDNYCMEANQGYLLVGSNTTHQDMDNNTQTGITPHDIEMLAVLPNGYSVEVGGTSSSTIAGTNLFSPNCSRDILITDENARNYFALQNTTGVVGQWNGKPVYGEGLGFYNLKPGRKIGRNKAYITVAQVKDNSLNWEDFDPNGTGTKDDWKPTTESSSVSAEQAFLESGAGFGIRVADEKGNVTSIIEVDAKGNAKQYGIYDLQGRRVEKAGKGVYIVNGQKVMFK